MQSSFCTNGGNTLKLSFVYQKKKSNKKLKLEGSLLDLNEKSCSHNDI